MNSRKEKSDDPEKAAWETPGEGDLFRPTELQFPGKFGNVSEKKVQNFQVKSEKTIIPHNLGLRKLFHIQKYENPSLITWCLANTRLHMLLR